MLMEWIRRRGLRSRTETQRETENTENTLENYLVADTFIGSYHSVHIGGNIEDRAGCFTAVSTEKVL